MKEGRRKSAVGFGLWAMRRMFCRDFSKGVSTLNPQPTAYRLQPTTNPSLEENP